MFQDPLTTSSRRRIAPPRRSNTFAEVGKGGSSDREALPRGRGDRVELLRGRIDTFEGEGQPAIARQILEALQVVIEKAAALISVGIDCIFQMPRGKIGRAGAEHGALTDKNLLASLSTYVHAAQLQAELGRTASQDKDLSAGIGMQRLALERATVE